MTLESTISAGMGGSRSYKKTVKSLEWGTQLASDAEIYERIVPEVDSRGYSLPSVRRINQIFDRYIQSSVSTVTSEATGRKRVLSHTLTLPGYGVAVVSWE